MKIETVSFSEKGRYVTLRLSGVKNSLVITSQLYSELSSPTKGDELSPEAYDRIAEGDEYYRATVRALHILSYSDNSRRRLYDKLRQRGISKRACESVVSDMVSLGYLDEQKQLRGLVLRLANESLLGPYKIMSKLSASGYSPSDIRSAMSELSRGGEIDFEENLNKLIEKRLAEDEPEGELMKLKYKWGYTRC